MYTDRFELIQVVFLQLLYHHCLNARIFNYPMVGRAKLQKKATVILNY